MRESFRLPRARGAPCTMPESKAHFVFLSYASQDAEAARRICESLRAAGVNVWFDVDGGLEHGDEWDSKIRRQIKDCSLFIPIISANTQARQEGYFRIEWELAAERAKGIASGVPYILPIVIDDTREPNALVPDRFRKVQWTRVPGVVTPEMQSHFLKLWSRRTSVMTAATSQGNETGAVETPLAPQARASRRPSPALLGAIALAAAAAIYFGVYQPAQQRRAREEELLLRQASDQEALAARNRALEQQQRQRQIADQEALSWVVNLPLTASDLDIASVQGKLEVYSKLAPAANAAQAVSALDAKRTLILAERERVHLEHATGGLKVTTVPAGAEVTVGGFAIDRSPATFRGIKIGKFPVAIHLDGYEEEHLQANVREDDFTLLEATLTRSTGTLSVRSDPSGLELDITSGTQDFAPETLKTPVDLGKVPTGDYALTFKRKGWPDKHETVTVRRNLSTQAQAQFAAGGRLEITSNPSGAVVWLGGEQLGVTPLVYEEFAPGPLSLSLWLKGYQPAKVAVEVASSATAHAFAALEHLPVPKPGAPWENSLGMRFRPVAGTRVLFSIWDTRIMDYDVFATETHQERRIADYEQKPTHPVVMVSWTESEAFCRWLTDRERNAGRLGSNQHYRLPTDEEWSIAVGLPKESGSTPANKNEAGSHLKPVYPWGSSWPPPRGAGNYAQSLRVDTFDYTSPVGSFSPNPNGLYDMHGNVFQWCEDFYNGRDGQRVIRGCPFRSNEPARLSLYRREWNYPDQFFPAQGFRCVIAFDPAS